MVHYKSGSGPLPSCRPPIKHLVKLGRYLAGRGDRRTQIGGENWRLSKLPSVT